MHLIGPPGTGKTHLSLALGVEAVKAGRSVYFSWLADIVASLAKAERDGSLRERIRYFCRFALLIVDEIGYLPVIPGGGNLFFQLVNARYEKGARILTSNRGFSEWDAKSSAIPSSRPPFSTGCSITPSSSRSRDPAIAYASTQTFSLTSIAPNSSPPPRQSHRSSSAEGGQQKTKAPIQIMADRQPPNWGIFRRHF